MQRVRTRKKVAIDDLLFPSPQITYDLIGRVEQLLFEYQSIVVRYDATWQGETNILDTYTQTVEEKTP